MKRDSGQADGSGQHISAPYICIYMYMYPACLLFSYIRKISYAAKIVTCYAGRAVQSYT
jgi:hypothetical protein